MLQNGVPQFVGFCRCTPCRQRRGKAALFSSFLPAYWMHPVQAAPRQSRTCRRSPAPGRRMHPVQAAPRQSGCRTCRLPGLSGCTPCRQRRGKDPYVYNMAADVGCTPCRQRRGKGRANAVRVVEPEDAPRAGSAEAKFIVQRDMRFTAAMHPVQAAPRQSCSMERRASPAIDAPRAGSAEAKIASHSV